MNTPTSVSGFCAAFWRARGTRVAIAMLVLIVVALATDLTPLVTVVFKDDSGFGQSGSNDQTLLINNPFFDPGVGNNQQSCATCHQPSEGFTVHQDTAQATFELTEGLDPLFRVIDTADRPDADVSTVDARRNTYDLIQLMGIIRIGKTIPATADFVVEPQNTAKFGPLPNSNDPQHLGTPSLSVFRRPLVNTNVRFDSSVLWDGRADITNMHAQVVGAIQSLLRDPSLPAPADNPAVDDAIRDFMLGVFTDQQFDTRAGAGDTDEAGATSGIQNLVALAISPTAPCLHDKTGANTPLTPSTCTPVTQGAENMTDFKAWLSLKGKDPVTQAQLSIARGEEIFNKAPMHLPKDLIGQIPGVTSSSGTGHANPANRKDQRGSDEVIHCTTCHAANNLGNHPDATFFAREGTDALDIITPLAKRDPMLQSMVMFVSLLPQYCLRPTSDTTPFSQAKCGTHSTDVKTTDPGRALVSGKIADVGKFKPPILRNLATRSPYFHAAAAVDIETLAHFYNARFNMGLSPKQLSDLENFLEAH